MNLLNKLTTKNLKLNKKRTVVSIIGIMLSIALITAVASMVVSFRKSYIEFEKETSGNYHYAFFNVKGKDLKEFENNRAIESYYLTKANGYAKIKESKNVDKPYAYIMELDETAFSNLGIKLIEGKFPEKEDEIVIPKHLRTNGGVEYKVGDVITLEVGDRTSEGSKLDQSNPYHDDEMIENAKAKTYKIVGRTERPSRGVEPYTAPGYTFITRITEKGQGEEEYNLYARYTKKALKNQYRTTANILGIDEELMEKTKCGQIVKDLNEEGKVVKELEKARYNWNLNTTLIKLEALSFSNSTMRMLYCTAGIVVAIIIGTSVFCIKNSFDISITEKTRQYGMLASIGATKKQIKKNVYFEALILSLIGIPLGILCGLLAAFILIHITNYFLDEMGDIHLIFGTSVIAITMSILLGIITIYLSARKSAKRASKNSPISAIRSNNDIKIKANKIRSPKIVRKIFGIGGEVSYKNLKRNKKKYRTTVVSIIVCVSVFIALYYFINLAYRTTKIEYGELNHNIAIYFEKSDDVENAVQKITSLENIDKICVEKTAVYNIRDPKYTKKYLKDVNLTDDEKEVKSVRVCSVGEQEYKEYLKKLNLKYEDAKDKAILINNKFTLINDESTNGKTEEVEVYDYKVGDVLQGETQKTEYVILDQSESLINMEERITKGEEKNIQIIKVTNERPLGFENMLTSEFIIVSDECIKDFTPYGSIGIYIKSSNPDKLQEDIEKALTGYKGGYSLNNIARSEKNQRSVFTLVAIFLYGFIAVIALIGITNIFNTITTNMELRSREFAMLKSIGMTTKEFNKMIRLESFFYGMKSLLIGIPIGIVLSYLIFKALSSGSLMLKYELPIVGILISIISVFLLIFCIMKYSINKINKQNTIETIRNENI